MVILRRRGPDGERSKGNAPRFDVWTHLYRMTGVDLTQVDGVDACTALKVVSEIGADMTKWPSAKHFASWLGLSPNNRITGGKVMSSKTKPSANRAAAARLPTSAPLRQRPAFLRRKKAQMGAQGHAHKLARLIYSMLRYGQEYVDAGGILRTDINSGPCARQSIGRRNWAINWCPCTMPNLRACPTDQRPRPRDSKG